MIPTNRPENVQATIHTEAVGFGVRAARTMLTGGRIERHLSCNELAALVAVAFEAGALSTLARGVQ